VDLNVREERRIILGQLPVDRDSMTGQLKLVEDAPPLLSAGESWSDYPYMAMARG